MKYIIQMMLTVPNGGDEACEHIISLDVGVSLNKAYEVYMLLSPNATLDPAYQYVRLVYAPDHKTHHVLAFSSKGQTW